MKVIVVGPCAAGTSTLAARLRARGYDARAIAQEHSYVPDLWRMTRPDALVYLDAGLQTILARRPMMGFGERELAEQRRRLEDARRNASLYLNTDHLTPDQVEARTVEALASLLGDDQLLSDRQ